LLLFYDFLGVDQGHLRSAAADGRPRAIDTFRIFVIFTIGLYRE